MSEFHKKIAYMRGDSEIGLIKAKKFYENVERAVLDITKQYDVIYVSPVAPSGA
jgi:hypothetical protein